MRSGPRQWVHSSACRSTVVAVSSVDSSGSLEVEAARAPPPAKKKFRRSAVRATQPAVSAPVDAKSNF